MDYRVCRFDAEGNTEAGKRLGKPCHDVGRIRIHLLKNHGEPNVSPRDRQTVLCGRYEMVNKS